MSGESFTPGAWALYGADWRMVIEHSAEKAGIGLEDVQAELFAALSPKGEADAPEAS